jgi:hypothetical protein
MTDPLSRARQAAFAKMDVKSLTSAQRAGLAEFWGVHVDGLDALHAHAKREFPPLPPPPEAGPTKVSDTAFASMSIGEKQSYAKQFDQSRFLDVGRR